MIHCFHHHSKQAMKYLCLICAETVMEQMSEADADKHYEKYREFTNNISASSPTTSGGAAT
jgi:hypothetical protein